MIIYPAIDLLDGRCVRLRQGMYDEVTQYSKDPVEVAQSFKAQGAKWIHVVDLNAAKSGEPYHHEIIAQIVNITGLKVQTGGGIRNMQTLERLLNEYKISRCVLGTAAIKDRKFTMAALEKYSERIAIGIDARDGEVAVDGWTDGSGVKALDFALEMEKAGAQTIVFTDIQRDGMMTGPALDQTRVWVEATKMDIIASGGIGTKLDIDKVREIGCAGVIVGKAIYEGKVRLDECLQSE